MGGVNKVPKIMMKIVPGGVNMHARESAGDVGRENTLPGTSDFPHELQDVGMR